MDLSNEELKQKRDEIKRQAKKERNKKQYEKTKEDSVICGVCACRVSKYYMSKHLETARHKNWELLQNKA